MGSPTMMNSPYSSLGDIVFYLEALRFNMTGLKRKTLLFGSKGWAGGGTKKLAPQLEAAGFEVTETYETTYIPNNEVLEECFNLGVELAKQIKEM